MPLIKLENINNDSCWGLWEITEEVSELKALLNKDEDLQRLKNVHSEQKLREKLAARLLVKQILENWQSKYPGTKGEESGKPILMDSPYKISLSHSHKAAVAMVHKKDEIGIDIELIQEKIERIAPRVFRTEEIGPNHKNQEYLTVLWTLKEVLYKIHGSRGLDFKENMAVKIVESINGKGYAECLISAPDMNESFILCFERYRNYIISFNTKRS